MEARACVVLLGMGRVVWGFSTNWAIRWWASTSTMPNWLHCDNGTGRVATLTCAWVALWKSTIWRTSMR